VDVCTNNVHSCAVDVSGAAWCWGENWEGQLGVTSSAQQIVPVRVETNARFTRISCGHDHTCALEEGGDVWCWGFAGSSPLGQVIRSGLPVRVDQLAGIADLAGANKRFGVLTAEGIALELPREDRCDNGNIDNKITTDRYTDLSCGEDTVCVIETSGAAKCFGNNRLENLCVGSSQECLEVPRTVVGSHRFIQVSTSLEFHCALEPEGSVWCWSNPVFEP